MTPGQTTVRPDVLLPGGSLARPSHTSSLLGGLERELAEREAAVCRWGLGERPLPFADPYHHRPQQHPSAAIRQLAAAARAAHALVLGSPVCHNSYSALLKNALGLLSVAEIARRQRPAGGPGATGVRMVGTKRAGH